MAYGDDYGPLDPASDTLSPLPNSHRNGLIAVAVCGIISLISTSALFLYLTYKLVTWRVRTWEIKDDDHQTPANDLSLGLAQRNFGMSKRDIPQGLEGNGQQRRRPMRRRPNQFLVLVYNLFLADMHQATAFVLNIPWIQKNEIIVGSPSCWAQGWFVSTGDLSASCFICAISIHTYLGVVKGYKPPHWALHLAIAGLWLFIYIMAVAGVAATNNGKGAGGFYVRAAAWCWVNVSFENLRLWLHYLWIFVSILVTSILYTLIFISLRKRNVFSRPHSHRRPSATARPEQNNASTQEHPSGHHPAFLIYPLIYVLCTAPLALGRIVTMSGRDVSIAYFCLAGAMIASNGWLDVLLFSTTRHSIIFNAPLDSENTGIETFAFMRTPYWRKYGNMVWVQGGAQTRNVQDNHQPRIRRSAARGFDKLNRLARWGGRDGRAANGAGRWNGSRRGGSQESLRGITEQAETGIQMDTVTTVVVEIEHDDAKTRSREPSAHSVDSSEKVPAESAGGLRL
ncbi:G protein-coupled glucose receptor regulating Gpa2-domain-containing protein [Annulohypoxylon maeteangense]|uniref:G protein-coupled glucose receptor regulating Gpa2-domain-containing protein n=1 Tax=Annulohypoxylon maeteangense TaxID=1927788 RepID=UPI002007BA73|nr:G protein-coupled glucose receptor regulating Gpa2-domain-containing protein [Annulohypoxylon maeteangense]KAI0880293.1 G protein-coupled glucose receptor regulating Gpa2-domain-containing protein [Annulohypoxylon maeteangense]